MIVDRDTKLSVVQSLVGIAVPTASTDYLNLGSVMDIGAGAVVQPAGKVDAAFDAATVSLIVTVEYGTAVDALGVPTFADAATACTVTILAANLLAGDPIILPAIPLGCVGQFLRFLYTAAVPPVTGSVSAGFLAGTDCLPVLA
jgi:hypothetical protein